VSWDFISAHALLLGELAGLLLAIAVVIVLAGIVIARFDRMPLEEAIYLAFITAFTVGFGDVSPKSRMARVVTVLLAFMGLVLIGVLVAVAAHALEVVLGSASA